MPLKSSKFLKCHLPANTFKARGIYFGLWTGLVISWLSACSNAPTGKTKEQLVQDFQWQATVVSTPLFNFMTYAPKSISFNQKKLLYIYIEGDGNAWETRYKPSANPTPLSPIGLELATQHPDNNVVYLARACQYLEPALFKNCTPTTWTQGRFSEKVVNATLEAIKKIQADYKAENIILIGFSGGGTIATKIAAKTSGIVQLITVAAPLNPDSWTQYHHVSALDHTALTTQELTALAKIPQIHFSGENDKTVPKKLTYAFTNSYPEAKKVQIIEVDDTNHSCCWVQQWRVLSEVFY